MSRLSIFNVLLEGGSATDRGVFGVWLVRGMRLAAVCAGKDGRGCIIEVSSMGVGGKIMYSVGTTVKAYHQKDKFEIWMSWC